MNISHFWGEVGTSVYVSFGSWMKSLPAISSNLIFIWGFCFISFSSLCGKLLLHPLVSIVEMEFLFVFSW